MRNAIAIISICFAALFSCGTASAASDGARLLYQAQMLERIKSAANPDPRVQTRRAALAYWDLRRAPLQN